jgi:hypothetical protein
MLFFLCDVARGWLGLRRQRKMEIEEFRELKPK